MKSTGIIRKVDELGRIVLPIEIRKILDIKQKDAVEIFTDNDRIVLQKYQPACIFCNSVELFHFSYQRYIENCLRDTFGFNGTPIKLIIRMKGDDKV